MPDNTVDDLLLSVVHPQGAAMLRHLKRTNKESYECALMSIIDTAWFTGTQKSLQSRMSFNAAPLHTEPTPTKATEAFRSILMSHRLTKQRRFDMTPAPVLEEVRSLVAMWGHNWKMRQDYGPAATLMPSTVQNDASNSHTFFNHLFDRKPQRPLNMCDKWERKSVCLEDLEPYTWNTDVIFHGTIIAWQKVVATQCLCRDDSGNDVFISLTFPVDAYLEHLKGARVAIYDPYLRVASQGGNLAFRVDCPDDFMLLGGANTTNQLYSGADLNKCKAAGDVLLKQKDYVGALHHYVFGLHYSKEGQLAAVVASNAAQAMLSSNVDGATPIVNAAVAARLAAAAMSIANPSFAVTKKSRLRYFAALDKLGGDHERDPLLPLGLSGECLLSLDIPHHNDTTAASPMECKEAGNKAFAASNFHEALSWYISSAKKLDIVGKMLGNMSSALLGANLFQPAIAASSAATLFNSADLFRQKSCSRVLSALSCIGYSGEAKSALQIPANITDASLLGEAAQFVAAASLTASGRLSKDFFHRSTPPVGSFTSASLEVGPAPGKGRGAFAAADIKRGEVLMISPPVCQAAASTEDEDIMQGLRLYDNVVLSKSDTAKISDLQSLAAVCPQYVVSEITNLCTASHDIYQKGMNRTKLIEVQQDSDAAKHLLVSSGLHPSCPGYNQAQCIEALMKNAFGDEKTSTLFIWPSMFNHDDSANCWWRLDTNGGIIVSASRPVSAGEELTLHYISRYETPAEERVTGEKKWNLPAYPFDATVRKIKTGENLEPGTDMIASLLATIEKAERAVLKDRHGPTAHNSELWSAALAGMAAINPKNLESASGTRALDIVEVCGVTQSAIRHLIPVHSRMRDASPMKLRLGRLIAEFLGADSCCGPVDSDAVKFVL